MELKDYEKEMLIEFLKFVLIQQQDSSCNDFIIQSSPKLIEFVNELKKQNSKTSFDIVDNEIIGLDLELTEFFLKMIDK